MVSILLHLAAGAALCRLGSAQDQEILWQFQRNNVRFYGEILERQLPETQIVVGETVTFVWAEGVMHGLYRTTSRADYESCTMNDDNGEMLVNYHPNRRYTDTPAVGASYYFDPYSNSNSRNCADGRMKITVATFAADDFVTPEPEPATTVIEGGPERETAHQLQWVYNADRTHDDIFITQDEGLRFIWSTSEAYSVWQVTQEAYESCTYQAGSLDEWTSGPQTSADLFVHSLAVGDNYFISAQPTHCSEGNMRLKVTVIPGVVRLWINVWSDTGTETSAPINATLVGFDPQARVWTAPSKQINQRATATDFAVYETLPIGANSNFFEMYALDVGHITSVRLTRPAGDDFGATYVRIRKPDNAGADAQTFRCSVTSLHHEVQDTDDQYCVVASDTTIVDPATAPVGSVAHDSCSCFREFKVVEDRVITCTSDGCYSSSADGQNGWSDMPEIAHITGIGTDGHLYGLDADDTVLASRDVGLTWFTPATVAPIDAAAPNYSFDVNALTTTPRDDDVVAAGSVLWGLTSQGVHCNTNGTWVLHGMWASDCAGACGLECNQPTPNLIER